MRNEERERGGGIGVRETGSARSAVDLHSGSLVFHCSLLTAHYSLPTGFPIPHSLLTIDRRENKSRRG